MARTRKASRKGSRRAEPLRKFWETGRGGTTIVRWGTPGAYTRCVRATADYVTNPHGYCAMRAKGATGKWPGGRKRATVASSVARFRNARARRRR